MAELQKSVSGYVAEKELNGSVDKVVIEINASSALVEYR